MNQELMRLAGVSFFMAFCIALAHCLGCSPSNAAIAGAYQAEQLACIEKASTKAEADNCRNAVKAQFGRLDAGIEGGKP